MQRLLSHMEIYLRLHGRDEALRLQETYAKNLAAGSTIKEALEACDEAPIAAIVEKALCVNL